MNQVIKINGPQRPVTPGDIYVPGDISSAAFFIVAALMVPGSDVTIENVGINPTRLGLIDVIQAMRGNLTLMNERYFGKELVADIRVKYTKDLVSTTIEGNLIPRLMMKFLF